MHTSCPFVSTCTRVVLFATQNYLRSCIASSTRGWEGFTITLIYCYFYALADIQKELQNSSALSTGSPLPLLRQQWLSGAQPYTLTYTRADASEIAPISKLVFDVNAVFNRLQWWIDSNKTYKLRFPLDTRFLPKCSTFMSPNKRKFPNRCAANRLWVLLLQKPQFNMS